MVLHQSISAGHGFRGVIGKPKRRDMLHEPTTTTASSTHTRGVSLPGPITISWVESGPCMAAWPGSTC